MPKHVGEPLAGSTPDIAASACVAADATWAGPGIKVMENARIQSNCVIAAGATVGRGAVIRAGSLVTTDVPAHAIVEGSPAQVVGFASHNSIDDVALTSSIAVGDYADRARPTIVELGVGRCQLRLMPVFSDSRGSLTVGQVPDGLPFTPRRHFLVYGVPHTDLRGEHAHKACEQFLICVSGSCRVLVDNGQQRCEVLLDRPDAGVYMPAMTWGTQYQYSPDAKLLVLASKPYDANDYIQSYEEFLAHVGLR